MDPIANPKYATLDFLVRYGDWVAIIGAALPLIGGVAAWLAGLSALFVLGGVVAAAFAYLLMRSYVELVRVIVDMLLPK